MMEKKLRLTYALICVIFALNSCSVEADDGSKKEDGETNVEVPPVESTLELPSVLSDHMVLQQNSSVCFS